MEFPELAIPNSGSSLLFEYRSLRGGALVQTTDYPSDWKDTWKILGGSPSESEKKDMVFAQKVARHVKSNAIVIVKNQQTLGICGGQTNRVDSVKLALARALERGGDKGLILGSDAFFPFRDSIDRAAQQGVSWIIQPGGSLRDAEVELAVQEHKIGMVITGTRHFKH
jgi:phosphoribosylaminoimidazolecarboxamide formyltransferase/IMP cyclohydrolase